MILGMYTDVHASINSSILPLYMGNDSKYTTRLDMIVQSYKWMYKVFKDYNVEQIINLGDTFDSHTVKAQELTAMSECYNYSEGIPEIHLVGNHEILDSDNKFYSTSLLSNIDFIKIYDKPIKLNDNISLLPYMKPENIDFDLLKSIENDILFSHIDIKGSSIRTGYNLEYGVDPEYLSMNFNFVFNGHIHNGGDVKVSNNSKIRNIGSMTSSSFSDSNSYIPRITVFNTTTKEFIQINNPHTILFRKIRCNNMTELIDKVNSLDKSYKYAVRINVPYDIKDDARNYIEEVKEIVVSRTVSFIEDSSKLISHDSEQNISSYDDINSEFLRYIENNQNVIKYPYDKYKLLIEGI